MPPRERHEGWVREDDVDGTAGAEAVSPDDLRLERLAAQPAELRGDERARGGDERVVDVDPSEPRREGACIQIGAGVREDAQRGDQERAAPAGRIEHGRRIRRDPRERLAREGDGDVDGREVRPLPLALRAVPFEPEDVEPRGDRERVLAALDARPRPRGELARHERRPHRERVDREEDRCVTGAGSYGRRGRKTSPTDTAGSAARGGSAEGPRLPHEGRLRLAPAPQF